MKKIIIFCLAVILLVLSSGCTQSRMINIEGETIVLGKDKLSSLEEKGYTLTVKEGTLDDKLNGSLYIANNRIMVSRNGNAVFYCGIVNTNRYAVDSKLYRDCEISGVYLDNLSDDQEMILKNENIISPKTLEDCRTIFGKKPAYKEMEFSDWIEVTWKYDGFRYHLEYAKDNVLRYASVKLDFS